MLAEEITALLEEAEERGMTRELSPGESSVLTAVAIWTVADGGVGLPGEISRQAGLRPEEVARALERLRERGIIAEQQGRWVVAWPPSWLGR